MSSQADVEDQPRIIVSNFDNSVENHFKVVDGIDVLCGESAIIDADEAEIERLSNSVDYVREWQDFAYEPRAVKFSLLNDSVKQDVGGEITLAQFSSASVSKISQKEKQTGNKIFEGFSQDFVMNVGGSVWGLDWCPKVNQDADCPVNAEFVAIAAHPPNSSYHKLGAPLTGRGAIQIWCFLSLCLKEDLPSDTYKKSTKKKTASQPSEIKVSKPRGRPRKYPRNEIDADSPKPAPKPRGRPRKCPRNEIDADSKTPDILTIECPAVSSTVDTINADRQLTESLGIEYSAGIPTSSFLGMAGEHVQNYDDVNMRKDPVHVERTCASRSAAPDGRKKLKPWKKHLAAHNSSCVLVDCEQNDPLEDPLPCFPICDCMTQSHGTTCKIHSSAITLEDSTASNIAVPRMMLCLAHDGMVAWDLKWRPVSEGNPVSTKVLGFLAVLLGNGALEVWEVPHPRALKLFYPANQESTDPRFIKLQPVFRCSVLKCGNRQSIPLTLEWSTLPPYDMLLAGCHDGLIALWKFCITDPSEETTPLLSFMADTGPIRTLAWTPVRGDPESANIVATAGPRGFKFWDIRDPFRPLWDHTLHGITYGLDWLPELRCIFGSGDDGALWLLDLQNRSSKQGLHSFECSSFAIWSIQASRLTGAVAYCGEEGTTNCFHPTSRYIKDPSRNRVQHLLCGSLSEEESTLVVSTPSSPKSTARFPSMKRSAPFPETRKKKGTSEKPLAEEEDKSREALVFPPASLFLRSLRWSPNKRSEKWLCYGGAAGLVRCQEVDFSIFHK